MLIVGDICAVTALHQHARWDYVRRMLPPACIGIVIGAWLMRSVNESMFRPVTGWIILGLAVLQLARHAAPGAGSATCRTTAGSRGAWDCSRA